MPNIGPLEIAIVLVIVLILFGAKRIPELGASIGQGMRNFKRGVTGEDKDESPAELRSSTSAEREPGEPSLMPHREETSPHHNSHS